MEDKTVGATQVQPAHGLTVLARIDRSLDSGVTLTTKGAALAIDDVELIDLASAEVLKTRYEEQASALREAHAIIEMFMPNVGKCFGIDIGKLNTGLMAVTAALNSAAQPAPSCEFCGGDGYHAVPRTPGIDCEACSGTGKAPTAKDGEQFEGNAERWNNAMAYTERQVMAARRDSVADACPQPQAHPARCGCEQGGADK